MSVRAVFFWLILLASVITGGEIVSEPGSNAPQAAIPMEGLSAWDRPVPDSRPDCPQLDVEESVLATGSESEEETNGTGFDARIPQAIVPFDPFLLVSVRCGPVANTRMSRRVTRLRC